MPTKERWQWPSTRPGISVVPAPSITLASGASMPVPTAVMRLPVTSTSAGFDLALSPSQTAAPVMSVLGMRFSR